MKKESTAPVEKLAEEVAGLEVNDKEAALKKKATTGLYFSNIPKDVRVSEFKNVLRERNVKLVFVKWKAFKQSAIVFFEDELDVVMKNLDGLTLQEELVKFEEVVPRSGGREPSKRPPKARKPVEKEEGGRRKKEDLKEVEAEKARKRTNRKEQRMKRREDFGGKFGIFVGKIPKGVTREDLGQEFAKLNVPLPDYVDWVVKKGHAFAFWQEADASLSLEVFTGISVGGTTLQVELYDTNRLKFKEERRKEENRESNEDDLPKKSPRTRKRKSESEKSPKSDVKESQNSLKQEDSKKASKPDEVSKEKPTTPKKTDTPRAKEPTEDKGSKAKASEETSKSSSSKSTSAAKKSPGKAPETPTKNKSPKVNGTTGAKSPNKTTTTPTKTPTPSKVGKAGGEAPGKDDAASKENCSIS